MRILAAGLILLSLLILSMSIIYAKGYILKTFVRLIGFCILVCAIEIIKRDFIKDKKK